MRRLLPLHRPGAVPSVVRGHLAPAAPQALPQASWMGNSGWVVLRFQALPGDSDARQAPEPRACGACGCLSLPTDSGSPKRFCVRRQQHFCQFLVCSGVGFPRYCESLSSDGEDNFVSPAIWDWQVFLCVCVRACVCMRVCVDKDRVLPLPQPPLWDELKL